MVACVQGYLKKNPLTIYGQYFFEHFKIVILHYYHNEMYMHYSCVQKRGLYRNCKEWISKCMDKLILHL